MILAKYENEGIVVRIHDECVNKAPNQCLDELERIVSGSYRRRKLEHGPSAAAMQAADSGLL